MNFIYLATFILLLGVATIFYFYSIKKKSASPAVDYSYNLIEAKESLDLLLSKNYSQLEQVLTSLKPDDLTLTLDYLALSAEEKSFVDWLGNGTNKNISHTAIAVFYHHQAWISRTNSLAKDVSEQGALGFFDYQEKALNHYSLVDTNSTIIAEVYSRLIRLYMGTSEFELAESYFEKAIQKNKNALWPYIHMAEIIEPKWGGSLEKIQALLKRLPDNSLIRQVVLLKFILDSYTLSENYLENQPLETLDDKAKFHLKSIHAEIVSNPPVNAQKYILYNYMYGLAETIGETELQNIYFEKIDGKYTLYPFGIIR